MFRLLMGRTKYTGGRREDLMYSKEEIYGEGRKSIRTKKGKETVL